MNEPNQARGWYNNHLEQKKTWYSEVAAAYNRVRPRYSKKLIDRVVEVAQLPSNGTILEIGCGPGTATTTFAQLGFSMVCLEPSPDAYHLAQQNCEPYPNVKIVNTTFEEWELEPQQFDAVLAATSFHWVSPEVSYQKAATALQDNGALILLWNMTLQPAYEVYQTLDEIYQTHAPSLAGYETREKREGNLSKFEQFVLNSGQFENLVSDQVECEVTYSIDDYLALLSTYSPYIALKPPQRETLFQRLKQTLKKESSKDIQLSYLSAFQIARKV